MVSAPAKAKMGASSAPKLTLLQYLKNYFKQTFIERSATERTACTFCHQLGDKGTFIVLVRAEGGEIEEIQLVCSTDCLLDHIEDELIDDRVERAVRDERTFLHEHVCPACKIRIRKGIEDGELEAPA